MFTERPFAGWFESLLVEPWATMEPLGDSIYWEDVLEGYPGIPPSLLLIPGHHKVNRPLSLHASISRKPEKYLVVWGI